MPKGLRFKKDVGLFVRSNNKNIKIFFNGDIYSDDAAKDRLKNVITKRMDVGKLEWDKQRSRYDPTEGWDGLKAPMVEFICNTLEEHSSLLSIVVDDKEKESMKRSETNNNVRNRIALLKSFEGLFADVIANRQETREVRKTI